ncbi:PDZ/DHR/GLGF domain protein [Ancylostoma ceylanicum]|uniref:PDZ/DHR/GLGF domain protein n=1 Tax=Ancylostoma ceylanicum TaxID=53326 RepID=A0A0D6LT75_9BILA|nr:PDZ/DHR/GLGF domain protein [Ancylostoma ceylanicum]
MCYGFSSWEFVLLPQGKMECYWRIELASDKMSPKRPSSLYNSAQSCSLKSYRSLNSINKVNNLEACRLEEVKLAIKSQFGAEFRRFSIVLGAGKPIPSYEEFILIVQNLRKALETRGRVLRLIVQHKGETLEEQFGYGVSPEALTRKKRKISISAPQDFRRVSSILDADVLPHELRRVRLCKFYNNKPLGFFIRDGFSERLTPWGFVPTPGIFISRLLPNGLAASTNLLNVNDEIMEVNGIEVAGKTLDQVTDVMIANSANLILTVKPAAAAPYRPMPYFLPSPCSMSPYPPGYYSPYGPRDHFVPPGYYSPQMTQSMCIQSNLYHYATENQPEIPR